MDEEQRRKILEQANANLAQRTEVPAFPVNFSNNINAVQAPQSQEMLKQQFSNPFKSLSERFGTSLTQGLTPLPTATALPLNQGPISMTGATALAAPKTAEQQGRQAIQTPRGTIYATEEQASAMMTPRTLNQQGSRTPAEQQALLAQMRMRGAQVMRENIAAQERIIAERRANPATYTTPIGASIAAPTNMFGQPIPEFQQRYAQREQQLNDRNRVNESILSSTGFGRSVGMASSGGPQPATAMTTLSKPSIGGPSTMAVGGSPFSFTPFSQRIAQSEPSPLSGFMAAINPPTIDRRFRPLPFGMRQFGTV